MASKLIILIVFLLVLPTVFAFVDENFTKKLTISGITYGNYQATNDTKKVDLSFVERPTYHATNNTKTIFVNFYFPDEPITTSIGGGSGPVPAITSYKNVTISEIPVGVPEKPTLLNKINLIWFCIIFFMIILFLLLLYKKQKANKGG